MPCSAVEFNKQMPDQAPVVASKPAARNVGIIGAQETLQFGE